MTEGRALVLSWLILALCAVGVMVLFAIADSGGVAEWLKALVLKTGVPVTVP